MSDPYEVARLIVLGRLNSAPRTRAELRSTLTGRGIPASVADTVLDRMAEVGLVNDAQYAQAWVGSRHRGRKLGKRALAHELRRKGVDPQVAQAALDQVDPESEYATASELVQRKLTSMRGLPRATQVRRMNGMLMRKGYGADVTRRAINDALETPGLETPGLNTLDADDAVR